MTIRDDLASLLAYNRWADARVIEAVRALGPETYTREPEPGWPSVRSTLVHVAGATRIWAARLAGETVTTRPTEDEHPTLDDAERLLSEGQAAVERALAASADRLDAMLEYRDLAGKSQRLPLWSVFRHVVNHATYHRGQVASKLRRLGAEPPSTDLAFWARDESAGP